MEFTRLADVEVVETANDTDKVLIEQNGEIKRVPKTEVGGSGGGNMLVLNATVNPDSGEMSLVSSSMTLDEAITAMSNNELTGAMIIIDVVGIQKMFAPAVMFVDYTAQMGSACVMFLAFLNEESMPIMWTADGIQEIN